MVPLSLLCSPNISEGGFTSGHNGYPGPFTLFFMFQGILVSFGGEGLRGQRLGTGVSLRRGDGGQKLLWLLGHSDQKQSQKCLFLRS